MNIKIWIDSPEISSRDLINVKTQCLVHGRGGAGGGENIRQLGCETLVSPA